MNYRETLGTTIHVSKTGVVRRGMRVRHRAANIKGDSRTVASPPRVVRALRFAPDSVPKGVNMHLPCPKNGACATCRQIDSNSGVIL